MKTLARYVTRYRKQKSEGNGPQRWVEAKVIGQNGCRAELAVLLSGGRRIEVKPALRANIDETVLLVLITEQGENRNQCEEQRNIFGFSHGFACR